MTTYLLDANVLIALTVAEHEHHERATTWVAGIERFALCPVVEGALVRFLVRVGENVAVAAQLLRAIYALPSCEFWPDALSYVDADLGHVRGHRQVNDAYLVGLAADGRGVLATLDEGLNRDRPRRHAPAATSGAPLGLIGRVPVPRPTDFAEAVDTSQSPCALRGVEDPCEVARTGQRQPSSGATCCSTLSITCAL